MIGKENLKKTNRSTVDIDTKIMKSEAWDGEATQVS